MLKCFVVALFIYYGQMFFPLILYADALDLSFGTFQHAEAFIKTRTECFIYSMLIHVNPIFAGYLVDKHLFKSTNEDTISTNWTIKIIS